MIKKIIRHITPITIGTMLIMHACDPNKDLYEKLDNDLRPHSENITYTLTEGDYSMVTGFVAQNNAFSDDYPAMDHVPSILARHFVTLREKSSAMVTFNHFLLHPKWWDAGFGYELTNEDYTFLGVQNTFTPEIPAHQSMRFLLNRIFPGSTENTEVKIIYNFLQDGSSMKNVDTYQHDGSRWEHIKTRYDIPYVGYELQDEDYQHLGGMIGENLQFDQDHSPELYLPAFLKFKFPLAPIGAEQVIRYAYMQGNQTDKYHFDGTRWHKIPYVEQRTEQYIFGAAGWAFDPTVIFTMGRNDYMYLVEIDPLGQQEFAFDDFAYYFGASAFYTNFDIRIIGRRLDKLASGEYADPQLGQIYEAEGPERVMEEMLRRIKEEGIIALLQHKYPDMTPQIGGIDVHLFVQFETFADNWVRRYPQAEYICVAAGDPPQFELVGFIENNE